MPGPPGVFRIARNKFVAGLIILVPIAITVQALWWLFDFVDSLSQPVAFRLIGREIPGIGFVTTVAPGPNRVRFRLQLPDEFAGRYYFIGLGGADLERLAAVAQVEAVLEEDVLELESGLAERGAPAGRELAEDLFPARA